MHILFACGQRLAIEHLSLTRLYWTFERIEPTNCFVIGMVLFPEPGCDGTFWCLQMAIRTAKQEVIVYVRPIAERRVVFRHRFVRSRIKLTNKTIRYYYDKINC